MLTGFGEAPVKSEGSNVTYDTAQESYTARYSHETIALAFSLTEEAIEDNLYDTLSSRYTRALARSMMQTKNIKGANILRSASSVYNSTYSSELNTNLTLFVIVILLIIGLHKRIILVRRNR